MAANDISAAMNASDSLLKALSDGSLNRLIEKYSTSGPRYTSYPTAVEFHSGFDSAEWMQTLESDREIRKSTDGFSLYFHIPFCPSLCYFCACNKVITRDESVTEPYLSAVRNELAMYRSLVGDVPVEQIHWGGGTPNFLSPESMRRLHGDCLAAFPTLTADADVSIEVDPRTCSDAHIRTLVDLGFNRLSMGVQDFDARVQSLVNRVQPFELTKRVSDEARALGIQSVNVDLIYGLPDQSVDGFRKTIEQILEIRPDRIALYGYAHVTWLKKVQKALEKAHLPTPSERVAIFLEALRMLTEAGYEYIGLDHFALPNDSLSLARRSGKLNRNFMGYSTHRGARLIGIGPSAISTFPEAFAQNTKDVALYQAGMGEKRFVTERGLRRSIDDQIRGDVIESILCLGTLDLKDFQTKWRYDFWSYFAHVLPTFDSFFRDGLLEYSSDSITLSPFGHLFSRNIAMAFDAYLSGHKASSRPVFSQAV